MNDNQRRYSPGAKFPGRILAEGCDIVDPTGHPEDFQCFWNRGCIGPDRVGTSRQMWLLGKGAKFHDIDFEFIDEATDQLCWGFSLIIRAIEPDVLEEVMAGVEAIFETKMAARGLLRRGAA